MSLTFICHGQKRLVRNLLWVGDFLLGCLSLLFATGNKRLVRNLLALGGGLPSWLSLAFICHGQQKARAQFALGGGLPSWLSLLFATGNKGSCATHSGWGASCLSLLFVTGSKARVQFRLRGGGRHGLLTSTNHVAGAHELPVAFFFKLCGLPRWSTHSSIAYRAGRRRDVRTSHHGGGPGLLIFHSATPLGSSQQYGGPAGAP